MITDFFNNVWAAVFMVFFFGMCVFIHELGHFLAAKWRGLHIDAFSIGFKKMWGKKINGIEYRIGYLPFGGYVELPQVDATGEAKSADGRVLPPVSPLDRMITAAAGPFFNILFGLFLGCFLWYFGVPQESPKMRTLEVSRIYEDSPEYRAGLRVGDKIEKLNGSTFFSPWRDIVSNIIMTVGPVELEVRKPDGSLQTITYQPIVNNMVPEKMKFEKLAWPFFSVVIPMELTPEAGSAAEAAGMKKNDILLRVNGKEIDDFVSFQMLVNTCGNFNTPLELEVKRGNEIIKLAPITPTPLKLDGATLEDVSFYLSGFSFADKNNIPVIEEIHDGSPIMKAGAIVGDKIVKINDHVISNFADFQNILAQVRNTPYQMTVKRGNDDIQITVIPQKITPQTIGVTIGYLDHPTPLQLMNDTVKMSFKSMRSLGYYIGNKLNLTDKVSTITPRNLSGPLNLGSVLFMSVKYGSFMTGLYFVCVITFALAIFNLLPLPVLDGGHITFAAIEMAIRRKLPVVLLRILSTIFVALLIGLMLYVTAFDIMRLFQVSSSPATAQEEPATEIAPTPAPPAAESEKK